MCIRLNIFKIELIIKKYIYHYPSKTNISLKSKFCEELYGNKMDNLEWENSQKCTVSQSEPGKEENIKRAVSSNEIVSLSHFVIFTKHASVNISELEACAIQALPTQHKFRQVELLLQTTHTTFVLQFIHSPAAYDRAQCTVHLQLPSA